MSTDDTIEQPGDEHPDLAAIESETNIEVVKERYRSLFKFTGKLLGENKRRKDRVREFEAVEAARQAVPDGELSERQRFVRDAERRLAKLSGSEYDAALAELHQEAGERATAEARRESDARRDALTADYRETRRKHEAQRLVAPLAHPDYAGLLADHVQDRIGVEEGEDGKPITTYKGKDGRPCSRDDLRAELRAEPAFSRIIVGASPQERALHAKRVAETLGLPAKH